MTCRSKYYPQQAEYCKRVYREKRGAGLCGYGGCREPSTASYCETHMAAHRQQVRAMVARRKADGLCVDCGAPVVAYTRCLQCRRKAAAAQRARKGRNNAYAG